MKRGVIESQMLFIVAELILLLMVSVAMLAYVRDVGTSEEVILKRSVRDVAFSFMVLSAAPSPASISLQQPSIERDVFMQISPTQIEVFAQRRHSFLHTGSLEDKQAATQIQIPFPQQMYKQERISFSATAPYCNRQKISFPTTYDFKTPLVFEQNGFKFSTHHKESPSTYATILAPANAKLALCFSRPSSHIAVAFSERAQNVTITLYGDTSLLLTELNEVFS